MQAQVVLVLQVPSLHLVIRRALPIAVVVDVEEEAVAVGRRKDGDLVIGAPMGIVTN